MSGLRERQKADRNQRIVGAATQLFRSEGYDRTKLESIAALAEVSVGTVYNYYENKGDLLLAIVALEVNEVLNAGNALVASPPGDIEDAINSLMSIYLDHSLVYLNKEMWREAMAITIRRPETKFGQAYIQLDQRLMDQICALIDTLRKRGLVGKYVNTRAVGEMFFNNMNMMFMAFVRDEKMELNRLKILIARQNQPLALSIRAERGE